MCYTVFTGNQKNTRYSTYIEKGMNVVKSYITNRGEYYSADKYVYFYLIKFFKIQNVDTGIPSSIQRVK